MVEGCFNLSPSLVTLVLVRGKRRRRRGRQVRNPIQPHQQKRCQDRGSRRRCVRWDLGFAACADLFDVVLYAEAATTVVVGPVATAESP